MDILVEQINDLVKDFRGRDFNHRRPDSIMISQHLFYEIRKTMEFANENPMFIDAKTILGMEILIISNKDNLMKVFIMRDY